MNLFDTHQAAKQLNLPSLGLAYLLKKICNFNAQKAFQLADWRMRPLSKELIEYSRSDTHFLLRIYDELRMDLIR